jgi:hypothetical protein
MSSEIRQPEFFTFLPRLEVEDPTACYWLRQVTLRLRREVCWLWQERGLNAPDSPEALPPFTDKARASLDMSRFWREKLTFYRTDSTAEYLSQQLETQPPELHTQPFQGSFSWAVALLELNEASIFTLGLALAAALDGSMGSVIALCQNDQAKLQPTLALAQKLWDRPEEILPLADSSHPLFRHGLLRQGGLHSHNMAESEWDLPLSVHSLVARQLLYPTGEWPCGLLRIDADGTLAGEAGRLLAARLQSAKFDGQRIVPVLGPRAANLGRQAAAAAKAAGYEIVAFPADAEITDVHYLNAVATLCWLKQAALYQPLETICSACGDKTAWTERLPSPLIPVLLFIALEDRRQLSGLPTRRLLPALHVQPLSYEARLAQWKEGLGSKAIGLQKFLSEIARRFRFQQETIANLCTELKALPGSLTETDLLEACRAELDLDIGDLASPVTPRFDREELILPTKQALQFEEHVRAMQALTEVHYGWGAAKAWNESGISVLFAGPPGTGKTMAAELLSIKLDLPMYRIDLSQVVNKYIGETEKNLKRLFDMADICDMILFFDEADALFGRRTEVSDAHDRYANLEISYLLERMERFKGLAILASNRKKDLDEAFLRRLRYVIDFPLPDMEQRKRIWQQVIPTHADASALDFDFLARQFSIAGGNIRSVVFNACLQSAHQGHKRLEMSEVLVAMKREFDKMNRSLSLEQFGPYASLIAELE